MAAKRTSKKKTSPSAASDPRERAVRAALGLAERVGWRDVSLTEIAAEADMPLVELYAEFRSKAAILSAFNRSIDQAVLAGDFGDLAGEPARDRLFDVLMRRLDTLNPYKAAIANIARDIGCDPAAVLCAGCQIGRSMAWMLEAAGISGAGTRGRLRVKGLAVIWFVTIRAWLRDDSEDMAHTMAVLDRQLSRADRLIARCQRLNPPTSVTPAAA